jgi:hypothetical protein
LARIGKTGPKLQGPKKRGKKERGKEVRIVMCSKQDCREYQNIPGAKLLPESSFPGAKTIP